MNNCTVKVRYTNGAGNNIFQYVYSRLLSEKHDPHLVQDMEKLEKMYFDLFLSELKKVDMFSNTAALFERCFSIV